MESEEDPSIVQLRNLLDAALAKANHAMQESGREVLDHALRAARIDVVRGRIGRERKG